MKKWKKAGVHKPFINIIITESYDINNSENRRFVAKICGWNNWLLYEGKTNDDIFKKVLEKTKDIRKRIEDKDENIFQENNIKII